MDFLLVGLLSILCYSNGVNNCVVSTIDDKPVIAAVNDKKSDLEDAIENALNYIKKALNSDSMDDLHYYARKAKNYASEAEDLADDLNLDDIEDYCHKGWRYARDAEGEDSRKDAVEYLSIARKALQNAYYCL